MRAKTQEDPMSQSPAISPYLTVDDAARAIDFYRRAFGAAEQRRQTTPDGKKIIHAALELAGGVVFLSDDFPEMKGGAARSARALGGSPVTIHVNLPDVDAVWQQAVAAGATVVMPLADMFWGDRYGVLEDPFGHRWSLGTPKRVATAAELDAGARAAFPRHS
jgi:PhnB protein